MGRVTSDQWNRTKQKTAAANAAAFFQSAVSSTSNVSSLLNKHVDVNTIKELTGKKNEVNNLLQQAESVRNYYAASGNKSMVKSVDNVTNFLNNINTAIDNRRGLNGAENMFADMEPDQPDFTNLASGGTKILQDVDKKQQKSEQNYGHNMYLKYGKMNFDELTKKQQENRTAMSDDNRELLNRENQWIESYKESIGTDEDYTRLVQQAQDKITSLKEQKKTDASTPRNTYSKVVNDKYYARQKERDKEIDYYQDIVDKYSDYAKYGKSNMEAWTDEVQGMSYGERRDYIDRMNTNTYESDLEEKIKSYEGGEEYLDFLSQQENNAKENNSQYRGSISPTVDGFLDYLAVNNYAGINEQAGDKNAEKELYELEQKKNEFDEDADGTRKNKTEFLTKYADENISSYEDYQAKYEEMEAEFEKKGNLDGYDVKQEFEEKYKDGYLRAKQEHNFKSLPQDEQDEIMNQTRLGMYINQTMDTGDKSYMNSVNTDDYDGNYLQNKKKELVERGYTEAEADSMLAYAKAQVNEDIADKENAKAQQYGEDHTVKGTLRSIPHSLKSGAGYIEAMWQQLKNTLGGQTPIDYNSPAMRESQYAQSLREGASSNFESAFGQFAYNAIASTLDSMAVAPISLVAPWMSGIILGSSAATSSMVEAHEKGLNDAQAVGQGLASGIFEGLFEKVSIDKIVNMKGGARSIKNYLLNTAKSIGIEGSEEGFTEIANIAYDTLVNGGQSDYNLAVENYVNQGYTKAQAKAEAKKDIAKRIGESVAGGMIGGAMFGGTFGAANYAGGSVERTMAGYGSKIIKNNTQNELQNFIKNNYDTDTDIYQQMKNTDWNDETQVGYLASSVMVAENRMADYSNEVGRMAAIMTRLEDLGVDEKDSADITKAMVSNAEISDDLRQKMDSGKYKAAVEQVSQELSDAVNGKKVEWVDNIYTGDMEKHRKNATDIEKLTQGESLIPKMEESKAEKINAKINEKQEDGQITSDGHAHLIDNPDISFDIVTLGVGADGKTKAMVEGSDKMHDMENVAADRDVVELFELGEEYEPKQRIDFFEAYRQGGGLSQPMEFASAYEQAYRYGAEKSGLNSALKDDSIRLVLTDEQIKTAYESGQKEYENTVVKEKRAMLVKGRGKGSVRFDNVDEKNLNKTQKAAVEVAEILTKAAGVDITFFASSTDENGRYHGENGRYDWNTNSIGIDINAGMRTENEGHNIMVVTLAHELTHYIERFSPEQYGKIQEFIFDKLSQKEDENINTLINREVKRLQQEDAQQGRENKTEEKYREIARSEIVARGCELMLTDKKAVRELAERDRGIFGKIKTKIDKLVKSIEDACNELLDREGNYQEGTVSREARLLKDYAHQIRTMWNEALKEAGENVKSEKSNEGVMFSIRQFKAGRQYVDIDTDQDIFDNADENAYPKIAQNVIKKRFQGKVVGITKKAFVNGRSAKEYGYPAKKIKDFSAKNAKMRASTELDNLIEVGKFIKNEPDGKDGHFHKNNVGGFDYYKTLFRVDNRFFEGIVNIEITNKGRLFKDITKIKDVTDSMVSSYGNNPKSYSVRTSSIDSISDNSENDNNILMQLRDNYKADIDNWYEKTTRGQRLKDNGRFLIGTTSEALKSINVKDFNIYFGKSKIQKILDKHKDMTIDLIKQVPEILEKPVIVMDSVTRNDSLVILGELYTDKGIPVMAALLVDPYNKRGELQDFGIITSAYDKKVKSLQNMINNSTIRYVDSNKKRTNTWLSKLRLQLPSQITKYGSINSISDEYKNINKKSKNEDIRYQSRNYTYDELAKKSDITIPVKNAINMLEFTDRRSIVNKAMDNLQSYKGVELRRNNPVITNLDTRDKIQITNEGIRHGISGRINEANTFIALNLGDAIKNGIKVNETEKGRKHSDSSYILMGCIDSKNNSRYYYRMIIDRYESNNMGTYYVDSLYACKAQKNRTSTSRMLEAVRSKSSDTFTSSKLSVAEFLNEVKEYYGDSLSEDVNKHFGRTRGKSDIEGLLYQDRQISPKTYDEALIDNRQYYQAKEHLREMFEITKGNKIGVRGIDRLTYKMIKETKTILNKDELKDSIKNVFDKAVEENLDAEQIIEQLKLVAYRALNEKRPDNKRTDYSQGILDELRKTRIRLTADQKAEIEYTIGGTYEDWRKSMMGKIIVANNGVALDSKWNELSELYPETFKKDVAVNDQPAELENILFDLQNDYDNDWGFNFEDAAEYCATEVLAEYSRLPEIRNKVKNQMDELAEKQSLYEEQLGKVRVEYAKRIREFRRNQQQSLREARQKWREEQRNRELKLKAEYEYRINKRVESIRNRENSVWNTREKEKLRNNIIRTVKRINTMVVKPTNQKHVSYGFVGKVAEFCQTFLENTSVFNQEMLDKLKVAYAELNRQGTPDFELQGSYDQDVDNMLETLRNTIAGKRLAQLSRVELEQINDIVNHFNTIIGNEREIEINEKKQDIEKIGRKFIDELQTGKEYYEYDNKIANAIREPLYNNKTPIYFFKDMGETASSLFKDIRMGQDKAAKNMYKAAEFITKTKEKHHYDDWNFDKKLELEDGLQLDVEQVMYLYATANREKKNVLQNAQHLSKGGIIMEKKIAYKDKKKIELDKVKTQKASYHVRGFDLAKISNFLTSEQKAYANEMVGYLSKDMAELGNETSMELYGLKKFNESYYFPYKTADSFIEHSADEHHNIQSSLLSKSFTKALQEKASTPVVIGNFTETAAGHINQMITYNALAVAQNNLNKVYNYKEIFRDEEGEIISTGDSVKQMMKGTHGDKSTQYMDKFISSLNGGIRADSVAAGLDKMISKFKKGAVYASLSVAIQQPSALCRAMALVDPKYFAQTTFGKRDWDECKKYCGVAIVKEMGGYDTGTGQGMLEYLVNKRPDTLWGKAYKVMDEKLLGRLPGKMDELTWCHIWNAVKKETIEKGDFKGNEKEFFKAASERFDEVINYTQVYDSVISRSVNMSSKDKLAKMATAFMAEPTVTWNLFVDALKGARTNKKYMARAVSAIILQTVVNAALKALVQAMRNNREEDEDKSYVEKYMKAFSGNVIGTYGITGDLNPLTWLPYAKDVISIFEGYDVERSDLALIADLKAAFDIACKVSDGKKSPLEAIEKVSGAIAAFYGMPVTNLLRDVHGVINLGHDIIGKNIFPARGDKVIEAFLEGIGIEKTTEDIINDYLENGDKSVIDEMISESEEEVRAKYPGYSDEKIREQALSSVRGKFTRVLKPKYLEADESERKEIIRQMKSAGLYMTTSSKNKKKMVDDSEDTAAQWEIDELKKQYISTTDLEGKKEIRKKLYKTGRWKRLSELDKQLKEWTQ